MNTLSITQFNAGYGPLHVVYDINLTILPGQRIGLVGLNGHGKLPFYVVL